MKKSLITLASVALLTSPLDALALGTTTVKVDGPKTAKVNDTIQVNVKLEDIKDTIGGIVAFGGKIDYNNEYLEYVGSTKSNTNYDFRINENILKIAGMDFSLENGIKDNTTVYTFTFKVLKEGNTTVNFVEPDAVDTDTSDVTATVLPLNININKEEVKEPVITTSKVAIKEETKKVEKVEKKEVSKEDSIKAAIKEAISNILKLFNK